MQIRTDPEAILVLDQAPSSQDAMADLLRAGGEVPQAVIVRDQTHGRGRFGRPWVGTPGDALAMSLAFPTYADHPKPWLLGMAVATATAAAVHARLQWPNDVTVGAKKLAGILTEIVMLPDGRRVAVVGVGVNLNQTEFPAEIAERALSLVQLRGSGHFDPLECAKHILERVSLLPEIQAWEDLRPVWMLFDSTPNKRYRLHDGTEAVGIGIGPEGELICSVGGETQSILAADAILGVPGFIAP